MLDLQIIEKFKQFQNETNKFSDLDITNVKFIQKSLSDLHDESKVQIKTPTAANKFLEIGDIDKESKKYDLSHKVKASLPDKGKWAPAGTILISRVRPLLGGFTIIQEDDITYTAGDLFPIALNDSVSINYMFTIICSELFVSFLSKNQNVAGQKPIIERTILYTFQVPIPMDLGNISSENIQNALVDFVNYYKSKHNAVKDSMSKISDILSEMKMAVLPSMFNKNEGFAKKFDEYASNKKFPLRFNAISFQIKRIQSQNANEVVCKKRMGFTPQTIDGNSTLENQINWFKIEDLNAVQGLFIDSPGTIKKTTLEYVHAKNGLNSSKNEPITKGDILVSFLATPGIVKIYNSDQPVYCNQAIDILTCEEEYYNKYIALNCQAEYPKYGKIQTMGINLNDEDKEKIKIFIPVSGQINSYDIQVFLADFIEKYFLEIDLKLQAIKNIYEILDRLNKTYLYRTFNMIKWEQA